MTLTSTHTGKAPSKASTAAAAAHHPYARPSREASPLLAVSGEKKHITISLSDPTLTRYGDAIYDPHFLTIALDPAVSEKEKLKAARGVRNRLSAACSRQKRKELLDGLREENEILKRENEALKGQVEASRAGTEDDKPPVPVQNDSPASVAAPTAAPAADGTIDPTTLTSQTPSHPAQSPHLALINQLIVSTQSMQQTIASLVVDRDTWKEKYVNLLSSITQLSSTAPMSHTTTTTSYATPPPRTEPFLLSPTKSTSSTLVSEYLLDAETTMTSTADDRSTSSTPSSSTGTPRTIRSSSSPSPSSSLSLPENTTCHPAAVATFSPSPSFPPSHLPFCAKRASRTSCSSSSSHLPRRGMGTTSFVMFNYHQNPPPSLDESWLPLSRT
ncbi:hypothetical protein QFC19_009261 [Naganishia cerealis]|uniref:Uncharacterized protein n=1 Tax=Naganishia cerealis TaxID=610337 RepID=A0ACC2UVV7_9TREE|nr:hypothetical protein QFC19_009261 [Naganishia cerealis]